MKELKKVFVVCGRIKQENAIEKPLLPVAMAAPKQEKETPDELKSKWAASDILPPFLINRQIRNLTADSSTGDSSSEVLIPMLPINKNQ